MILKSIEMVVCRVDETVEDNREENENNQKFFRFLFIDCQAILELKKSQVFMLQNFLKS